MKIGLKNSLDILNDLTADMDFAVNEQCAALGECQAYANFIATGKPVFQIEYPTPLNAQAVNGVSCKGPGVAGLSTILKDLQLNGIAYYCDGSYVNTPTLGGASPPRPSPSPKPSSPRPTPTPRPSSPTPPRPSSTPRPSPTPRPSTTLRPTPTPSPSPSRTSSTQRPTSTPGGGGGTCRQKHWDQCGGNDWKGCTVCEVLILQHSSMFRLLANSDACDSRRIRVKECLRRIITSAYRFCLVWAKIIVLSFYTQVITCENVCS